MQEQNTLWNWNIAAAGNHYSPCVRFFLCPVLRDDDDDWLVVTTTRFADADDTSSAASGHISVLVRLLLAGSFSSGMTDLKGKLIHIHGRSHVPREKVKIIGATLGTMIFLLWQCV